MLEMEALQGERTVSRPMQNLSPDSIACGNGMEARKCKESFDVSRNHCAPRIQTELLYYNNFPLSNRTQHKTVFIAMCIPLQPLLPCPKWMVWE